MKRDEALAKLKEQGVDESLINALMDDGGMNERVKALEAKLEAESGKSSGILSDKKKAQQRAEELQAKLEELEHKDLGEVDKLKLEMQRMQSKLEQAESQKAEIEGKYSTEKRDYELNKIAGNLKWLDTVPENIRKLTIQNEFADMDLGNEILVKDKLKSMSESYAGLLASETGSGAGSKAGQAGSPTNLSRDQAINKPLADIARDPIAYVKAAQAAIEAS